MKKSSFKYVTHRLLSGELLDFSALKAYVNSWPNPQPETDEIGEHYERHRRSVRFWRAVKQLYGLYERCYGPMCKSAGLDTIDQNLAYHEKSFD